MARRPRLLGSCPLASLVLAVGVALAVPAIASAASKVDNWSPSDTRAVAVGGNVVNCGQIGLGGSTTLFASGATPINSGDVSSTITGGGALVNVTLAAGSATVIDAIVVKGGPAHNVYSDPSVLPPVLNGGQAYKSPLNNGGNVPTISHWFLCVSVGDEENPPDSPDEPGTGSLSVRKVAVDTAGTPVSGTYTVHIDCDDPADSVADVSLTANGGAVTAVSGVVEGSFCTVVETSVPQGTTVTYSPSDANSIGVEIRADSTASVVVRNTSLAPTVGGVAVGGVVVTAAPSAAPAQAVTAVPSLAG